MDNFEVVDEEDGFTVVNFESESILAPQQQVTTPQTVEPLSDIQQAQLDKRKQMNIMIQQVREMRENNGQIGTALTESN